VRSQLLHGPEGSPVGLKKTMGIVATNVADRRCADRQWKNEPRAGVCVCARRVKNG